MHFSVYFSTCKYLSNDQVSKKKRKQNSANCQKLSKHFKLANISNYTAILFVINHCIKNEDNIVFERISKDFKEKY